MRIHLLLASTSAISLAFFVQPAIAGGPPAGVSGGPPSFVTMGPPASVTMGPPAGVTMGPPANVTMGPPAGVTMGPPASVTMGPPAAAMARIPHGVPLGQPATLPQGASASGGNTIGGTVSASAKLNAHGPANESTGGSVTTNTSTDLTDTQEANAASELGKLNAAHASATAMAHASSKSIVGQIAAYKVAMQSALAETDTTQQATDITAARVQLASTTNKQLTPDAISKVDNLLGITGADPTLGTTP